MDENEILSTPLAEPAFTKSFSERCRLMGFKTVADIVFTVPAELINKKGFSYSWLNELIAFLGKNQAIHLLQPMPGKSRG